MGAPTPVAVGTRGTIGSLVRKEIEYFSKFELENSQRPQPHYVCRPSFWVFLMTGKRRKRRDNSVFLPKMCSVTQVVKSSEWNRVPGYGYRILKDDINNIHLWLNFNLLSSITLLLLYLEFQKLMLFSPSSWRRGSWVWKNIEMQMEIWSVSSSSCKSVLDLCINQIQFNIILCFFIPPGIS